MARDYSTGRFSGSIGHSLRFGEENCRRAWAGRKRGETKAKMCDEPRALFIRQGVDGVFLGSLECGVERSGEGPDNGNDGGPQNPPPGHNHLQQG